MKKCLLVNNAYPSLKNPNYSTYTKSIEECIKESGCEVSLLVIRFKYRINVIYKILLYIQFWFRLFLVNMRKYDVVYVNQPTFAWPLFINPTFNESKVINHWHGDDIVIERPFLKMTKPLIARKSKSCTHVAPSNYFKGILSGLLNIDERQIVVSPSGGVDTKVFKCVNRRVLDTIVIGFSSGMSKSKGSDIIISLIDRVDVIEERLKRKVMFKIINYGDDMLLYDKKLLSSNCVELVQTMPKSDMPNYYNSIDVLLMTSRRSESLGLVVLEALSCGKPVISFDLFAFPEFILPGISGELVDYCSDEEHNVNGFVESIEKVINAYFNYHPQSVIQERYSKEYVINQYKQLL